VYICKSVEAAAANNLKARSAAAAEKKAKCKKVAAEMAAKAAQLCAAADAAQIKADREMRSACHNNPLLFCRRRCSSTPGLSPQERQLAIAVAAARKQQIVTMRQQLQWSSSAADGKKARKWLERYNTCDSVHPISIQCSHNCGPGRVCMDFGGWKVMVLKGSPWGQDIWQPVSIGVYD
jgi:hypothetical protein